MTTRKSPPAKPVKGIAFVTPGGILKVLDHKASEREAWKSAQSWAFLHYGVEFPFWDDAVGNRLRLETTGWRVIPVRITPLKP